MLLKSLILFLIANQSAKAESQESLIESYIENALYKLQSNETGLGQFMGYGSS